MRDEISDGYKAAMKAGDKRRTATLRAINAAIKDKDIEARGLGKEPLADADVLALLQKMVKQREESLGIYEKAGREDLAVVEREEIVILSEFLPKGLSEAEVGELGQNVCIFHICAECGRSPGARVAKTRVICGKPPRGGAIYAISFGARQAGTFVDPITRLERHSAANCCSAGLLWAAKARKSTEYGSAPSQVRRRERSLLSQKWERRDQLRATTPGSSPAA